MAFNTLLLQVLCGPDADFINKLLAADWTYYVLNLFFLLIALFTIMNMLIGILCGVVAEVTEAEREETFMGEVDRQIRILAQRIDKDGSGKIDKDEFDEIIRDPALTQSFHELGVDIVGAADFGAFIFAEVDELTFIDFTHLVSQFRGSKNASLKDMMDTRKFVSMELSTLSAKLLQGEQLMNSLAKHLTVQEGVARLPQRRLGKI